MASESSQPPSYLSCVRASPCVCDGAAMQLMFGLLVGTVSNALTRASATAHKMYTHSKKVAEVDEWLRKRDLPEALAKEVEVRQQYLCCII